MIFTRNIGITLSVSVCMWAIKLRSVRKLEICFGYHSSLTVFCFCSETHGTSNLLKISCRLFIGRSETILIELCQNIYIDHSTNKYHRNVRVLSKFTKWFRHWADSGTLISPEIFLIFNNAFAPSPLSLSFAPLAVQLQAKKMRSVYDFMNAVLFDYRWYTLSLRLVSVCFVFYFVLFVYFTKSKQCKFGQLFIAQ